MDISQDSSLKEIFEKIDNETLLLPDFQRDYKWSSQKQQSLLASILLNFPVGSSLILKGASNEFALRRIGETSQYNASSDFDCEYLLDGQQRTTTLYNAFNDVYDFRKFDSNEALNKALAAKANPMKVRWFIRIPTVEELDDKLIDFFNVKGLIFDKAELDSYEPNDIYDMFSSFPFNEKKKKAVKNPLSPYFSLFLKLQEEKKESAIITKFVKECVAKGLLPLFAIGSNDVVIQRVLQDIAEDHVQAIFDKYNDDLDYIKENYDKNGDFEDYNSIEDFVNIDEYHKMLHKTLNSCAVNWMNDVRNYLINDIYGSYKIYSLVTKDIRRAIPIFCHLNDGGMKLDDFDLISAKIAKKLDGDDSSYSLSNIIRNKFKEPLVLCDFLKSSDDSEILEKINLAQIDMLNDGLPTGYITKNILAVCTILCSAKGKVSKNNTSSKTLFSLTPEVIRGSIEKAIDGIQRALAFLIIRCGVHNAKKLHYTLMIQPIAYLLSDDAAWNSVACLKKIEYWYWTTAFSGRYLYDQSAVVIEDINQLHGWVYDNDGRAILAREDNVLKNPVYSSKVLLLQKTEETPNKAIHSFILQYVLSRKPFDLAMNNKFLRSYACDSNSLVTLLPDEGDSALNDHHIIPLGMVTALGEKTDEIRNNPHHILNSPLNRAFISFAANNKIKAMDPSRYTEDVYQKNTILSSLFMGAKISSIATNSTEGDIIAALDERFDLLAASVLAHLLKLRT